MICKLIGSILTGLAVLNGFTYSRADVAPLIDIKLGVPRDQNGRLEESILKLVNQKILPKVREKKSLATGFTIPLENIDEIRGQIQKQQKIFLSDSGIKIGIHVPEIKADFGDLKSISYKPKYNGVTGIKESFQIEFEVEDIGVSSGGLQVGLLSKNGDFDPILDIEGNPISESSFTGQASLIKVQVNVYPGDNGELKFSDFKIVGKPQVEYRLETPDDKSVFIPSLFQIGDEDVKVGVRIDKGRIESIISEKLDETFSNEDRLAKVLSGSMTERLSNSFNNQIDNAKFSVELPQLSTHQSANESLRAMRAEIEPNLNVRRYSELLPEDRSLELVNDLITRFSDIKLIRDLKSPKKRELVSSAVVFLESLNASHPELFDEKEQARLKKIGACYSSIESGKLGRKPVDCRRVLGVIRDSYTRAGAKLYVKRIRLNQNDQTWIERLLKSGKGGAVQANLKIQKDASDLFNGRIAVDVFVDQISETARSLASSNQSPSSCEIQLESENLQSSQPGIVFESGSKPTAIDIAALNIKMKELFDRGYISGLLGEGYRVISRPKLSVASEASGVLRLEVGVEQESPSGVQKVLGAFRGKKSKAAHGKFSSHQLTLDFSLKAENGNLNVKTDAKSVHDQHSTSFLGRLNLLSFMLKLAMTGDTSAGAIISQVPITKEMKKNREVEYQLLPSANIEFRGAAVSREGREGKLFLDYSYRPTMKSEAPR